MFLPTYLPYFFWTVTGNKQFIFLGLMEDIPQIVRPVIGAIIRAWIGLGNGQLVPCALIHTPSLVLGQEFFYLYIFYMKTLPTLNCVYPDLVLNLLTRWPTVRIFQFYDSDWPECITTLGAIYHQPQVLTPIHITNDRDQNREKA